MLLDKCVPNLVATEITGKDGAALFDSEPKPDNRQTARAILALLAEGQIGLSDSKPLSRRPDLGDGEAAFENGAIYEGGGLAGEASSLSPNIRAQKIKNPISTTDGSAASLNPSAADGWRGNGEPETGKMEVGEGELIGDQGHYIELVERVGDGRERYFINAAGQRVCTAWGRDEATRLCQELIETGRMTR